ncbi:MAG: hypothetical protein JHC95_14330 [Solirubrobacteraceae bacterium]|nr:hypothetical protein [Solirubrobacteraceae bacterium]
MGYSVVRRAAAVLVVAWGIAAAVAAPSAQAAWSLPKYTPITVEAKNPATGQYQSSPGGLLVGSALDPAVWPAGLRKTTWLLRPANGLLTPNCGVDAASTWSNNKWLGNLSPALFMYTTPFVDLFITFRCDGHLGPSHATYNVLVPAGTIDARLINTWY